MPWTKAKCPDGHQVSFDECLGCTNRCCDLEVCEALFERELHHQDPAHVGNSISVTSLLGCMRSTYLERIIDYAATPESMWFSLRGELIHRLVERPDMDNPYLRRSEMRVQGEVDGVRISGRIDNYKLRFLESGVLKDWKSIGDNGLQYIIYEGAKEEHIWQTNIYAWLCRQNGYRVDRIEIAYLSLMQIVRTGHLATFNEFLVSAPAKSGKRKNMVTKPRLVKGYPSGKKKWECTYRIPDVPMFDADTVIEFISPRVQCLREAFDSSAMPPIADEETRKWKCAGYCRVREQCEAHEASMGRTLVIPE